jgi:hypothetical protein
VSTPRNETAHNGWTKDAILHLIATNDRAVERGLVQIYWRQTSDEQSAHATRCHNGRGFTAFDAPTLTGIAQRCIAKNGLTPKQLALVRRRLVKYWKQLLEIAADSSVPCPQGERAMADPGRAGALH